MKDSVYKISLDINEHGSQAVLKAKKTDTGRKVHITLRAGGTPYTIEDDCYAVFTATKPDGSILYNACTIEGNEIVYEFTEQTCAAVGRNRCEIRLYGLDDKLITSPRFALLVDGTVYPEGSVESSDEFSALTQMVSDTLAVQETASASAESANEAAANANESTVNAIEAAENAMVASEAANKATISAESAATTANQAAESATQAAQEATEAGEAATDAAEAANKAAISAETAAEAANQAAAEKIGWLTDITLPASAWAGADSLYSQVVTIDGITEYSKVDLLPSVEQLAIFHNKDVAFVTENEDGVVTVYAIGDKPTLDYTMQAQITEVEA